MPQFTEYTATELATEFSEEEIAHLAECFGVDPEPEAIAAVLREDRLYLDRAPGGIVRVGREDRPEDEDDFAERRWTATSRTRRPD